jgi:hypothetical protein
MLNVPFITNGSVKRTKTQIPVLNSMLSSDRADLSRDSDFIAQNRCRGFIFAACLEGEPSISVPSKRTSPRSKRLPLFASTYNVDFGFDCCGLLCRRNLLEAVPLQMPWRLQGPLVNTRRIMVEAWFSGIPFLWFMEGYHSKPKLSSSWIR